MEPVGWKEGGQANVLGITCLGGMKRAEGGKERQRWRENGKDFLGFFNEPRS